MKTWGKAARHVGMVAGATIAGVASFLTFPGGIVWMAGLGTACYGAALILRGSAWPLPSALLVILLVKRTDTPVFLSLYLAVLGAAAILDIARFRRIHASRWQSALVAGMIALSWGSMAIDRTWASHTSRRASLAPDRPVVCLGDSLTARGWPEDLAKRISAPVLDFSSPGIDTNEGILRLPAIVAVRPQIVIVELGGHDFLRGSPRAETRRNLVRMITELRACGAEVVLFEIPRGLVMDGYSGLERDLARKFDLEIIPDTVIRELVVWSRHGLPCRAPLSDDGIHPNAAGNARLASAVHEAIQRITRP